MTIVIEPSGDERDRARRETRDGRERETKEISSRADTPSELDQELNVFDPQDVDCASQSEA